jgi:hypothetical protein
MSLCFRPKIFLFLSRDRLEVRTKSHSKAIKSITGFKIGMVFIQECDDLETYHRADFFISKHYSDEAFVFSWFQWLRSAFPWPWLCSSIIFMKT